MIIIARTVVAAAGTPGPLLGDGVNTTCTLLIPASQTALRDQGDSLGHTSSVLNRAASATYPRQHYTVARLQFGGLTGNGDNAFFMAAGVASALGVPLAASQFFPPLGSGLLNTIDLGDFDVDVVVSGNAVLWIAEVV